MDIGNSLFKRLSIRTKQFIVLFLLVAVGFAIMQWINIKDTQKSYKEKFNLQYQELSNQTSQFLSSYLKSINEVFFIISNRQDLFAVGKEHDLEEFLKKLNDYNEDLVMTIYVEMPNGSIVTSKATRVGYFGNSGLKKLINEVNKYSWDEVWSEPFYSSVSGKTILVTLPVSDLNKTNNKNDIIRAYVELNLESLQQKLIQILKSSGRTFIITSSSGETVIFDNESLLLPYEIIDHDKKIKAGFIKQIKSLDNSIKVINNGSKELFTINSTDNPFGWNMHIIADGKMLKSELSKIIGNFYMTMFYGLIVIIGITFFMTYYFTYPIIRLSNVMNKINNLENIKLVQMKRQDEIGLLVDSFNKMINRISTLLIEVKQTEIKKKEYELKALQSQINPHFLCNTLICIASLAKQQRTEEIRDAIKSIITMLSFSFDKVDQYVTLEEEIINLEAYIGIQKLRYGDIFKYSLNVSSETLPIRVMKLILQPLVENSIFHGLQPKQGKGFFYLHTKIKKEKLIIRIMDNGIGITKEKRIKLLIGKVEKTDNRRFNSIGLINVHERLQLQYGEGFGLRISSSHRRGTVVSIVMPNYGLQ